MHPALGREGYRFESCRGHKGLPKRQAFICEMISYTVYILYSDSLGQYYVGQTYNLEKRLLRHHAGHGKHTKKGIPWSLIWTSQFDTRSLAVQMESKIKKRGAKRYLQDIGEIE